MARPPYHLAVQPQLASQVRVFDLPDTEEAKSFRALYDFYAGQQHDHCPAHWGGERRAEGVAYYRERYLIRGFVQLEPGPAHLRKPDVVTPIAREIVETFTTMLLGRTPQIHVPVDSNTADFLAKVWSHGKLQAAWTSARNMAGAARAAVVVPMLIGGRPIAEVISPAECHVLRWSEREVCQPALLVRQRLVTRQVVGESGHIVSRKFWRTCAWDELDFIEYVDVPEEHPRDEPIQETRRSRHGCQRCPATWYRNTSEGSEARWGRHDFAQLEGRCDAIDQLGSQLRGSVGNNTDPTMFQADEEGTRRRHRVRSKGRGTVIELSEKGRVGFAEISATSIEAAQRYLQRLEEGTLAQAKCVRITPELVAAAKSGKHMQILFAPAKNYASYVGIELADAIVRVLECFYEMATVFGVSSLEQPREGTIILPSRVVQAPSVEENDDEEGGDAEASGEMPLPADLAGERASQRLEPAAPGRFGGIEITFGSFFESLPEERNVELAGLQQASGGEPVLSRRTAIEGAALVMGADPLEERRRIAAEEAERLQAFTARAEALEDKADGEPVGNDGEPEPEAADVEADEGDE